MDLIDKEITKSLECCVEGYCQGCVFGGKQYNCKDYLMQSAHDFINCQQAREKEITEQFNVLGQEYDALYKESRELKAKVERLQTENKYFADLGKMYSEIRAEAIEGFVERFEDKVNEINFPEYAVVEKMLVICKKIMNDTVKEIVGDNK